MEHNRDLRLALLYVVSAVDPMDFHTWPGIDITQLRLTSIDDSESINDADTDNIGAAILLIAFVNWIIVELILLAFKALRRGAYVFAKFQSGRYHNRRRLG